MIDHQTTQIGAMTIQDFCKWAGIGRSLAYGEMAAGRLSAVKAGKRTLIRFAEAQRWLNSLPCK